MASWLPEQKKNLTAYRNVSVFGTDGSEFHKGIYDAIFVNAGATHPLPEWLDSLEAGGRLLLPITIETRKDMGGGFMLRITRGEQSYDAEIISVVGIFHCAGARDARINEQLKQINLQHLILQKRIFQLKREKHSKTSRCILHTDFYCLSADAGE